MPAATATFTPASPAATHRPPGSPPGGAASSTAAALSADGSSILASFFHRNTTKTCACYRCGRSFDLPSKAQTASCPHCHKHLQVEDVIVRSLHWGGELATCGSIVITKKARATCKQVVAAGSVTVLGTLEAKVKAGGEVRIGPGATFRGSIDAPHLHVENGASLEGGPFRITSGS